MITTSKENYLKAILEAESEGLSVISATLAKWLSVTRPAVSTALRRLSRDGLLTVSKDGRVHLTREGLEIARRTVRRHHLVERMLSEIFEMEWYKVHDEAERLEHAVSEDFEAKLKRKLGPSEKCPHGNKAEAVTPAERRRGGLLPLYEGQPGKLYAISSVYERDRRLLEFLEKRGMRPDTVLFLKKRNYDETITVRSGRGTFYLGRAVAEKVWVKITGAT
jgi:DtxR family transcriptional regulator, iron-dependent repressor